MPVPDPKVTGFAAVIASRSITLMASAMLAANGAIALPCTKLNPVPALKVSVPWPVPRSAMTGSAVVAGSPVVSSPGLAGVGV